MRRMPPLGLVMFLGVGVLVPVVVLSVFTVIVVRDVRRVEAARPTALHVTRCWQGMDRKVPARYCRFTWTLADGSRGSQTIEPDDPEVGPGSTVRGWAAPGAAWLSWRGEPLVDDWPIPVVIGVVALALVAAFRGFRQRQRRAGTARGTAGS
jgi:hypothetical protein